MYKRTGFQKEISSKEVTFQTTRKFLYRKVEKKELDDKRRKVLESLLNAPSTPIRTMYKKRIDRLNFRQLFERLFPPLVAK